MATRNDLWLPWKFALVGQENRIEATQNMPDVRFLDIRFLTLSFLPMPPLKREHNAASTIADEIW